MPVFHILMSYMSVLKFRLSERRGIFSLFIDLMKKDDEWERFKLLDEIVEPFHES